MAFKNNIPEFKSFSENEYYMHTVPDDAWTPLEGMIRKAANSSNILKAIINNIAEISGGQMTNNWGWGFLESDIPYCVMGIRKKVSGGKAQHFEAFMDSLAVLHDIGNLTVEDINEFLEDHSIGYRCERNHLSNGLLWFPVASNNKAVEEIVETQKTIKSISAQAYDRFESALRQFEGINRDERARKDAVRSCVDAMEALVKELGSDSEIGMATKQLKDETAHNGDHIWGPAEIVKDGNSLFNLLHKLYPDLRHGTQDYATADMTMEEAEYFVGRITVFMKYIAARAKKLGRF